MPGSRSDAGHRGFTLDRAFAFAGRASIGQLALGAIIGQVLHRYWAPVGATLQGLALERSAARAKGRGWIPLWERLPLAPPVVRERFAREWREESSIRLPGKASRTRRLVLGVMLALGVLVTMLGILAKFWIAHGHSVPYLAP